MSKFNLVLLIHAHQPAGNFDDVMERTYQQSYLPFVECLARHPRVRVGLHYTGSLVEWMAEMHPEYIQRVGALVARGQVEIVGGGFYEPILVAIPYEDRIEQIRRLSDFVEKHFGKRPQGAWLAERVWEPQLPTALSDAGMAYTLVDDSHFLTAGREMPELFGYYVADDCGKTVKVIPGLQELRYLLPFGTVQDSIAFLRRCAADHPGGMACMGDDMEKFGAWPHTFEHCFRDGWLDNFFSAIEANFEWVETVPPAEALATHEPLGRVDLPTASYTEMMEWVLPTSVRQKFHSLLGEFSGRPDVCRFLRGGFWRGFFSKYSESNLLQKKMLRVSSKLRGDGKKIPRRGAKGAVLHARAITHLLRAQCNDAYWHGIFGGLYAPHLRTELWRELVRAETIADGLHHGGKPYQTMTRLDFDADGTEEIEITSPEFGALIKPARGGTIEILDFRPSAATLINSLQRRVEAYHSRLQNIGQTSGKVASIHDQTLVKEPGLEKHLKYDRWPRSIFRLLLFAPGKTHADFEALQLEENAALAGGDYHVEQASAEEVDLSKDVPLREALAGADPKSILAATKVLRFEKSEQGFNVRCKLELALKDSEYIAEATGGAAHFLVGLEVVINLLAPNVPDRYIEFAGTRQPLQWSGVVDEKQLKIADEWQNVAVEVEATDACHFWISPIQTVSESEEGFERVYQGSQILALWNVTLDPMKPWTAETILHVSKVHNS
ncbi:MAG TPA: alpha-amylase/4-alpha-glucanotransferase domain-containing protein [Candidatus Acidoferrales bacterium]|nr:alpha-amylase/4-alpha-glucanotransferase domain-containing protein [Candidatus Acidoferrales bacterium]